MEPTRTLAELVAYGEGYASGFDAVGCAGECPFTHDDYPLRAAWLRGFSAGRIDRQLAKLK
jgi:ribosome modulation factor